jgi:Mlc titration factor MtfA (ptsG expression regulator)
MRFSSSNWARKFPGFSPLQDTGIIAKDGHRQSDAATDRAAARLIQTRSFVLRWFRHFRRRRGSSDRLPDAWMDILRENAPFSSRLPADQQAKLRRSINIMVAEKYWEGCGGLTMTDQIKVTVAAHASRLTLGFDGEHFDGVRSILVYPNAYLAPQHQPVGSGVVVEAQSGRTGEAWPGGPVILSWADALAGARQTNWSHNLILHEFAHQLDLQNGRHADGVPVIESAGEAQTWLRVMTAHYDQLRQQCSRGRATVLDCYGAVNMAEFFAVATEAFFQIPQLLRADAPELYAVLRTFYRQDPALSC